MKNLRAISRTVRKNASMESTERSSRETPTLSWSRTWRIQRTMLATRNSARAARSLGQVIDARLHIDSRTFSIDLEDSGGDELD